MVKVDEKDTKDEFQIYLERRITHQEVRNEKLKQYSQTDKSKLNSDQIGALLSRDKLSGSLEELKSLEMHYRKIKAQSVAEQKARSTQQFEIISSFLQLMTVQFQISRDANIAKNITEEDGAALTKLLYIVYSGGEVGGSAISKLVEGSPDTFLETGVPFSRLREMVIDQNNYGIASKGSTSKKTSPEYTNKDRNTVLVDKNVESLKDNKVHDTQQVDIQSTLQAPRSINAIGSREKPKLESQTGSSLVTQNKSGSHSPLQNGSQNGTARNQDKEKSQRLPASTAVNLDKSNNAISDKTNANSFQVVMGKKDNKKRPTNKQRSGKKNSEKSK